MEVKRQLYPRFPRSDGPPWHRGGRSETSTPVICRVGLNLDKMSTFFRPCPPVSRPPLCYRAASRPASSAPGGEVVILVNVGCFVRAPEECRTGGLSPVTLNVFSSSGPDLVLRRLTGKRV